MAPPTKPTKNTPRKPQAKKPPLKSPKALTQPKAPEKAPETPEPPKAQAPEIPTPPTQEPEITKTPETTFPPLTNPMQGDTPKPDTTIAPAPDPTTILAGMNTSGSWAGKIDPEKIAAINVNEPEGAPLPEGEAAPLDASQVVAFEVFYANFEGVFFIASATSPMWSPVGQLESIAIQQHEQQAARKCAEVLYGIACKTPMLRWMVSPGSESAKNLSAVATFAYMKYATVKAEVAAKMAQPTERKAA